MPVPSSMSGRRLSQLLWSSAPQSSRVLLQASANAILCLTNPHISEYSLCMDWASSDAILFSAAKASSPGIPSAE
eukprot:15299334-Ditylum_brightwellii.AAC.1